MRGIDKAIVLLGGFAIIAWGTVLYIFDDERLVMGGQSVLHENVTADDDGGCPLAVQNHTLTLYTSSDGTTFTMGAPIASRTSVPNLLYDHTDDSLLLAFQSFDNDDMRLCDRMAYARLSTSGEFLTDIAPLSVTSDAYVNGFDPTFVDVNGRLALVYTVRPAGLTKPCISLGVANGSGPEDGFTDAGNILWCSPNDDENYMDASAALSPDGTSLYLFVPSDAAMSSQKPVSYVARIDVTNDDPSAWTVAETGTVDGLGFFLLGEVVSQPDVTDCPYVFFGTNNNTLWHSCAMDPTTFAGTPMQFMQGADPGVARLPDGSYVLVVAE